MLGLQKLILGLQGSCVGLHGSQLGPGNRFEGYRDCVWVTWIMFGVAGIALGITGIVSGVGKLILELQG